MTMSISVAQHRAGLKKARASFWGAASPLALSDAFPQGLCDVKTSELVTFAALQQG